jgi:crotonobetainyl-CoA:carnitine CoA-transferase CaiB-like acyl-CoA transferase
MAGPLGTQTLGDYGADVIKVEALPDGDPLRQSSDYTVGDESALFLSYNRGKRSLAVDLRTPEGVEVVRKLAARADVVAENYRPGIAQRIGIGYDDLQKLNSRLIYVSLTGFGQSGPYANSPATDALMQAVTGVMSLTGEVDGEPVLSGIPLANLSGANQVVEGVTLALLARHRTGAGQHVDVAMQRGLIGSLTTKLAAYWFGGEDSARYGSGHTFVVPFQAFRTKDGSVVATASSPPDWRRFCIALGHPELSTDARFLTNTDRRERRSELTAILSDIFERRTTSDWTLRFQDANAQLEPVLSISQALAHPQVLQSGLVQEIVHPVLGKLPQIGPTIGFSDTPGAIQGPPPFLGEHSVQILDELGYTEAETEVLIKAGVIVSNEGT